MRFYTQQHKYYCGVDLHARSIYVCILNQEGAVLVHKNLRAKPDAFWSKIEKQFRVPVFRLIHPPLFRIIHPPVPRPA